MKGQSREEEGDMRKENQKERQGEGNVIFMFTHRYVCQFCKILNM